MSHAFIGVLTGARILSIELDRACFLTPPTSLVCIAMLKNACNLNSGRWRRDNHVRRDLVAHATFGVPRLGPDRRRAHRVRVRHQREQGRQPRPRSALVGETERPVRISSPRPLWFSFLFLFFWLMSVICGFGGVR